MILDIPNRREYIRETTIKWKNIFFNLISNIGDSDNYPSSLIIFNEFILVHTKKLNINISDEVQYNFREFVPTMDNLSNFVKKIIEIEEKDSCIKDLLTTIQEGIKMMLTL